jgi:hypothetical protein
MRCLDAPILLSNFSVDFDDLQPHAAGSTSQSQQERRGERSRDLEEHLGEAARTSSQRSGRGRDGQHSAEHNEQGLLPGPSARVIESRGSGKRRAPQTGGLATRTPANEEPGFSAERFVCGGRRGTAQLERFLQLTALDALSAANRKSTAPETAQMSHHMGSLGSRERR